MDALLRKLYFLTPSFSLTSEHFFSGCSGGRGRGDSRRLFSDLFSWTDGTAAPGRRALRLEEGGPVLAFSLEKIPKQGCTQAMVREHWEGIVGGRSQGIGKASGGHRVFAPTLSGGQVHMGVYSSLRAGQGPGI